MQVTNGSKEGDPFGLEGGCCKLRKSPTSKSIGERKLYIYIYINKGAGMLSKCHESLDQPTHC